MGVAKVQHMSKALHGSEAQHGSRGQAGGGRLVGGTSLGRLRSGCWGQIFALKCEVGACKKAQFFLDRLSHKAS